MSLPATLPAKPTGWTRELVVHMNFGRAGGAASYKIKDAEGNESPINFVYNTRDKVRGFTLPDVKEVMTWEELRARWPKWLAEHPEKTTP